MIDRPVFSCLEGRAKPDPRLYEIVCAQLAISAERCLYVGDGDGRELAGAVRQGMDAVMIRIPDEEATGGYRRHPEEWDGPRIASLPEILVFLGAIDSRELKRGRLPDILEVGFKTNSGQNRENVRPGEGHA